MAEHFQVVMVPPSSSTIMKAQLSSRPVHSDTRTALKSSTSPTCFLRTTMRKSVMDGE